VRLIHYYGLYSSRCKARWHRLPHIAYVAPQGWKENHAGVVPTAPVAGKPQTVPHAAHHGHVCWQRSMRSTPWCAPAVALR
jgi:hypothetical protein